MRQKKSKKILYILAVVVIVIIAVAVSRDITPPVEHVEEVISNDFLKR